MIKLKDDKIVYSEKFKGDDENYNWAVRFDIDGKYLGITQFHHVDNKIERVLLSPSQVKALCDFLAYRR